MTNNERAILNWTRKMQANVSQAINTVTLNDAPFDSIFLCIPINLLEEYMLKQQIKIFTPTSEDRQSYGGGYVWWKHNNEEEDTPYEERALACGLLIAMIEEGEFDNG